MLPITPLWANALAANPGLLDELFPAKRQRAPAPTKACVALPPGRASWVGGLPPEMWREVFAHLAPAPPYASGPRRSAEAQFRDNADQRLAYRRLGAVRRTCRAFDEIVWHSRPELVARIASVLSGRFLRRNGAGPRAELTRYLQQTTALTLVLPTRALTSPAHEPLNLLLARAPLLRQLEVVGTQEPTLDVAQLALELVPELEALRLRGVRLGPSHGAKLRVHFLPRLQELELSATGSPPQMAKLLRTTPSLRRLRLVRAELKAKDVGALPWSSLLQLEVLDLSENPLGNEGLAALRPAEVPWLRQLFVRDVCVGSETASGTRPRHAFRFDLGGFLQLRLLDLRDNCLNVDDAKLLNLSHAAKLRGLELSHNYLRATGFMQLRHCEAAELRWLEVGHNRINPMLARGLGLQHLDDGSMRWERDQVFRLPTPWTDKFWQWLREALIVYGAVVPL